MADLTQASREELLAIIAELQARIAELQARIAELEAERAGPGSPPKTPDNSSVPPSQGFKANRAERRRAAKRGPKPGHPGQSRLRQTPDVIVRAHPTQCHGCHQPLPERGHRRVGRSQVVDIPPVRPVVIEAWRYGVHCPSCGVWTVAPAPEGLEATRTFGPGIETLLGYLHERHHLSYARLVEVCHDVFDLRISAGAIANALARLGERARPAYDAIGAAVRGSPVINSDETSARINGRNHWHWVFQTPEASYHVIAPSRGARVIDAFLEGAEPEVWVSDVYAAQVGTAAGVHQICMAHQLRDLTYAVDADDIHGRVWAVALRHLFGRAIRLHRERASITAASFARRKVRIVRAARRLVCGPPLGTGEAWGLQRRYRKHWDDLFVFLDREDVEPTNNSSERDLRNAVIHRKVTGGYRSDWGAEVSAILTSVLATARNRGDNLWGALRALAGPSAFPASIMGR
ncbi:MAG: IS66 family transposase [Chloroflexota bacterium]